MSKYKLSEYFKCSEGRKLYQIESLKSFRDVKEGDRGGWIESTHNLDQQGTCWVYDDAIIFGNARVSDDSQVRGNAIIRDDALIFGSATISDNARISENARVCGKCIVRGNANISEEALVTGGALVLGNVSIRGNAMVGTDATISENASIIGNATVSGEAAISGNVVLGGTTLVAGHSKLSGYIKIIEKGCSIFGNFEANSDKDIIFMKDTKNLKTFTYSLYSNSWSIKPELFGDFEDRIVRDPFFSKFYDLIEIFKNLASR